MGHVVTYADEFIKVCEEDLTFVISSREMYDIFVAWCLDRGWVAESHMKLARAAKRSRRVGRSTSKDNKTMWRGLKPPETRSVIQRTLEEGYRPLEGRGSSKEDKERFETIWEPMTRRDLERLGERIRIIPGTPPLAKDDDGT